MQIHRFSTSCYGTYSLYFLFKGALAWTFLTKIKLMHDQSLRCNKVGVYMLG